NDREPHPPVCPSHHWSLPAVEGDVPHNPDSIHPEHGSNAPAVSCPAQQPSMGERSVVIPSPSCSAAHRKTHICGGGGGGADAAASAAAWAACKSLYAL
ncbi:hypothetical protein A2U01_0059332, partial [Trifolium medium]|nr:hypothetical protein [Trifolium medium]